MKLAIISDFHIGYERFRSDAYNQAEEALSKAAELADAIIIPGDIFDFRTPKPDVIAEGISLFRSIANKPLGGKVISFKSRGKSRTYTTLPVIAIAGTHERRAAGEENPVSLLNLAGFVVDVSDGTAVVAKGNEQVAITGVGGIAEEHFREYLKKTEIRPVQGMFNVFMFHQSIYELLPFSKDFIHYDELPEGFDLYVDGHIHNRVEATVHGKPFIIPGSTVLTQLKEAEQESKGFYIFDTADNSFKFYRINSRRFVVRKIDISNMEPGQIKEAIVDAVKTAEGGKKDMPIVLVQLSGSVKQGFKREDVNLSTIPKELADVAIVEVNGAGLEEAGIIANDFEKEIENLSVRDFGMSLFTSILSKQGYSLSVSPTKLFEILSSDSKEKAVKNALAALFGE